MSGFPDRENQLFDILEIFTAHDLEFLVIGGYAVSAYQHRFSVDADIVITAEQFDRFATLLRDEGYEKIEDVEQVRHTVGSDDFRDAYKGVFTAQDLPQDRIAAVQRFSSATPANTRLANSTRFLTT